MKYTINEYIDGNGESPYANWLDSLKDVKGKAAILSRIDRMELGLFGDCEPVGDGISELRIHLGPGYRVYFAKEGNNIYLILCAGKKSTQKKDIKRAKQYWSDFKNRED